MFRRNSYKKGNQLLIAKAIRQQQRFIYIPGKGSLFDKLSRVHLPCNWFMKQQPFMYILEKSSKVRNLIIDIM